MFEYFRGSFLVTAVGLGLGALVGWTSTGTLAGTLGTLFIVAVLAVLEVSLSFDNAVVNATVLREMDAIWRRRFLTWGIAIAVFGMRIVFPVVIVAVIAWINPWAALRLAATDPGEYSRILTSAHVTVSAFGGAFLAMVGLKYFFNQEKEVHWLARIERPLTRMGRIEAIELGIVMLLLWWISGHVQQDEKLEFLVAGMLGLITYIAVDGIGAVLESGSQGGSSHARSGSPDSTSVRVRSGLGAFLYLEVLDASFSFDGVIGAFALSKNLLVIAIGLSIGAMFVRSMTIFLVDLGTLAEYRYLEHGAFWAILSLGVIMFLQAVFHIPEVITGSIGAGLIGWSFASSLRHNRDEARASANGG